MNELDQKLRELVRQYDNRNFQIEPGDKKIHTKEDLVKQIKSAFQEAGWREILNADGTVFLEGDMIHAYRSGQEWFDRFEQQFLHDNVDHRTYEPKKIEWTNVLKAARKAAGLEER